MSILFSILAILAAIDAVYNVIKSGPIDRTLTLAGSALFFLFLRYICKRIARRGHCTPSSGGGKRFFLNLLVLLITVSFAIGFSQIAYVQRVPEAILAIIVMTFLFFLFVINIYIEPLWHPVSGSKAWASRGEHNAL